MTGEYPDIVIACVGGGSNFGGFVMPFVQDKITKGKKTRIIAVEPTSLPKPDARALQLRFRRCGRH